MVLSIPRPGSGWQAADTDRPESGTPAAGPRWAAARGAARWSVTADIAGAFPGFGPRGGILIGGKVRVTDRYLLVDEGRAHGFGLRLETVQRLAVGMSSEAGSRPRALLHVTYDDGRTARSFAIRPRTVRFGWSRDRVGDALAAFRGAGHEPARDRDSPSFLVSWEEARRFRDENVIWSGRATAPLDPLGFRRAGCDVWLTTRSLMWSLGAEQGINRIPLARTVDALTVDLHDRAGNPGLALGYLDRRDRRRDLVLIFDRHLPAERNDRERGAMLVGFRSRGIGPGSDVRIDQPWRRDWWPAPMIPISPSAMDDDQSESDQVQSGTIGPLPTPNLVLARAYEAEALSALAAANARARGDLRPAREPGIAASLTDALAELETAETLGVLTPAAASVRRARLLALTDAGSRLRALLRLRQADHLAPEHLDARRLAILAPLNQLIIELT